jgi:hypothetical protein
MQFAEFEAGEGVGCSSRSVTIRIKKNKEINKNSFQE